MQLQSDPKEFLMEKRIGVIAILVENRKNVDALNGILSKFGQIIIGRMGLPIRDKGIQIISLIVEGDTDRIGAMSGQIGRLGGIQVKSLLTNYKAAGQPEEGEKTDDQDKNT
jgi:putative iron-only hydrogenase system regulator